MTKLGQFRVKEEDDSANSLRPGALFFSRINKTSSGTRGTGCGVAWAERSLSRARRPGRGGRRSRHVRLSLGRKVWGQPGRCDVCLVSAASLRGESVAGPGPLTLSPVCPSIASASDPAGPSYAAATLQASSAASSASPTPKAVGSASKVRPPDAGAVGTEKAEPYLLPSNPPLPPQPQESPKGKRKPDLSLEDKKPPSKPSAGPPAPKRPKCEQTGFLGSVVTRLVCPEGRARVLNPPSEKGGRTSCESWGSMGSPPDVCSLLSACSWSHPSRSSSLYPSTEGRPGEAPGRRHRASGSSCGTPGARQDPAGGGGGAQRLPEPLPLRAP